MSAVTDRAWGADEPDPVPWVSGAWSLELRGDELADIRFDGTIVLRSVRGVARDRDWGTVPSSVSEVGEQSAGLQLAIGMRGLGADIDATLDIGASDDRLTIRFVATVHDDFWSNRLGLVVLHPPTVAGSALRVTTPRGDTTSTRFPTRISPHQPAFDIAELAWTDGGVASVLAFSGDTFEMEDQRNWTDASFKTYSTPLALPFPVLISAGSTIEQTIVLSSERIRPIPAPPRLAAVTLTAGSTRLPLFGVSASTAADPIPDGAIAPAGAVLVELDARSHNWPAALARASQEAAGGVLDVRLVVSGAGEVDELVDALVETFVPGTAVGARMQRLGVYSTQTHVTEPDLWARLVARAAELGPHVELVGGTRGHFTELNRTHDRLPPDLPALTFSVTPQMHATNRYQLVESIAMQRLVAENATMIAGDRPVHVGPVTLRPRFNAVATSQGDEDQATDLSHGYGAEAVLDATDPRQSSPALAAWTIASAAALSVSGVASVSYFESWGARGVSGHPVGRALEWLTEIADAPVLLADSELPDELWMIAALSEDGPVALVANLRDTDATVDLVYAERLVSVEIPALSAVRVPLAG